MLGYQRGLLPLHASCVTINSSTIAIAGESGAGKSTLAATLALQGVPILADDVCMVDVAASDGPVVWPTVSRLKLWRDALDRLGVPLDAVERVRQGVEKYSLREIPIFRTEPAPLSAVYHLTKLAGASAEPHAVSGLTAVKLLHRSVYRPQIGRALGRAHDIARALMTIAATVPVFHVSRDPESTNSRTLPGLLLMHQRTM